MTSSKRVLVSGGGIGGLTLAYWLHRYGFTPVVVERAPALRTGGYAIDFAGSGYDIAERMNVVGELRSRQVPVDELVYVNGSGERIAALPFSRVRELVVDGRYLALMHQTLASVLYDAVRDDVEIRFGSSLASVVQDGDGVNVAFENGERDRFDLVIGADGIHSRVRELAAGPEERFRRFMGYALASYKLPDRYGLGRTWTMNVEPGRIAGVYASDEPGNVFAFFMWKCPEAQHRPREQRLAQLREAFAGAGWIAGDMLAHAPDAGEVFVDIVAQIEMPSWHDGRVAFIGDACACPTLASGQGSSLAMAGAYLIAQALRDSPDHESAFARYESAARPYVEQQQKAARSFMKQFIPATPLGIALQRMVLKVIFRDPFLGMLRRQFNVRSIVAAA